METEDPQQILFEKLIRKLKQNTNGTLHEELIGYLEISSEQMISTINSLSRLGILKIDKSKTGSLMYFYQDPDERKIAQTLSSEELKVYQVIVESKNKGVQSTDLKDLVDIPATQITTIIKKLEKKNLIKSIKSIRVKNRKIWFKINIEPDVEATGGLWFKGDEYNGELISAFYSKIMEYLQTQGSANKNQILVTLRTSQITDKDLQDNHIQNILDLLIYDDKIQEIKNRHNPNNPIYKLSNWDLAIKDPEYVNIPCAACKLINQCQIKTVISPENCIYFEEW